MLYHSLFPSWDELPISRGIQVETECLLGGIRWVKNWPKWSVSFQFWSPGAPSFLETWHLPGSGCTPGKSYLIAIIIWGSDFCSLQGSACAAHGVTNEQEAPEELTPYTLMTGCWFGGKALSSWHHNYLVLLHWNIPQMTVIIKSCLTWHFLQNMRRHSWIFSLYFHPPSLPLFVPPPTLLLCSRFNLRHFPLSTPCPFFPPLTHHGPCLPIFWPGTDPELGTQREKHWLNASQGGTLRSSEVALTSGAEPTCLVSPLPNPWGIRRCWLSPCLKFPFPCAELGLGFTMWQLIFREASGLGHTYLRRFVLKSLLP